MTLIYIRNAFKTFKLVMIIFMASYFIGILFYIWSDITNNLQAVQDKGTDVIPP